MSTTEQATADMDQGDRAAPAVARRAGLVRLFPHRADVVPEVWRVKTAGALGRGRDAAIRLSDTRISRVHATIEPRADGVMVRDRDSRHGTYVDGKPADSAGLLARDGSIVRAGDTILLVTSDVDQHLAPPRRIAATRLGLPKDVIAGPTLAGVWDQAIRIARLSESVMILGDTGSGKECVARIVHAYGGGAGPFVGINVAAIPDALFEGELFGHDRGAFTGATGARLGAFREAADGVLFLDEIGDLRPDLQVKLLRAIDLGRIRPLGASGEVPVTARVVCATSRALDSGDASSFRQDLWYRLSGIVIRVPPLRERREDVMLLASEILREQATELALTADAAEKLLIGAWEGNARQLRHVVARAVDLAGRRSRGKILAEDVTGVASSFGATDDAGGPLTAQRIRIALLETGGVVSRAAERLGVSRTTFYNAVKRLKVSASPDQ